MARKVLLVEDEQRLRRILALVLTDAGYQVKTARDGQQGIDIWTRWLPDAVVTDLKMHPVDGMAVLKFGRLNFPNVPLVLLTAFGSIETAVTAMKMGAFDFLSKPVEHVQLLEIIEQALDDDKDKPGAFDSLIGSSPLMMKVKKDIRLFASTNSSVLISGESGTGKELAARGIHEVSDRKNGPFVKVNCAAIPKDLIESELFGHKKGAFTGALHDRKGAFLQADNGVLLLDEIGDFPIALQPKLLNAVEEKFITPIGSDTRISVSIKIVSATNMDIETMIRNAQFRKDLYYRLNTLCLNMPALRDKPEDIRELAEYFVQIYCRAFNKTVLNVSREVLNVFKNYSWPGNVRELKNVIENIVITCDQPYIGMDNLPEAIGGPEKTLERQGAETRGLDMAAHERSLLLTALKKSGWNQSKAARELCITRSALRYRLQKYGIK
jgi:two-component system NtrC family response regulator